MSLRSEMEKITNEVLAEVIVETRSKIKEEILKKANEGSYSLVIEIPIQAHKGIIAWLQQEEFDVKRVGSVDKVNDQIEIIIRWEPSDQYYRLSEEGESLDID